MGREQQSHQGTVQGTLSEGPAPAEGEQAESLGERRQPGEAREAGCVPQ